MDKLNELLSDLGISKVRLAKYLGVSRQMLYNYLALKDLNEWPNEKEFSKIKIDGNYIMDVETRLNEGVKDASEREVLTDLKGFNKKEQELLTDIINLLKEKLQEDNTKDTYNAFVYLYHYLQSMGSSKELKYILAYISKSMGFTNANEFLFNPDQQFIFESIMFSGMSIYHNNEEKLSRTQELNTAKVQALRELGYNAINESNAKEVLEKIAEIQSRKV